MYLSNFLQGFVKIDVWISITSYMDFNRIDTWISLICYMAVSKLPYGFVKVVTWIGQCCFMYFSPFAKQNQVEVWPQFQSLLKLLLWTNVVEWVKLPDALGLLCLWKCFVTGLFLKLCVDDGHYAGKMRAIFVITLYKSFQIESFIPQGTCNIKSGIISVYTKSSNTFKWNE